MTPTSLSRSTWTFLAAKVAVQVWAIKVGRVRLILLDTNLPENRREDQEITNQLYGGDQRVRIQQEIVLGIGGIRALAALGATPRVCHINEGHAAFSGLERIRLEMETSGLSFAEARVATGGGNLFTTHTPVPAGFDLFPVELMREFFAEYVRTLGITMDGLLSMGRSSPRDATEPFNMAIMALRNSAFTNAVSVLHGRVTRTMVAPGFKGFPVDEIPIDHVTNGIHLRTRMSKEMTSLLDRYLGSGWTLNTTDPGVWKGISRIRKNPPPKVGAFNVSRSKRLFMGRLTRISHHKT